MRKSLAILFLVSVLLAGTAIPAMAYPNPGPPNVNGAIGELEAIAVQLNVMSGRINSIAAFPPSPILPEANGAIGQLSAMSTELDVVSAQVGNILRGSAGSGTEADPGFIAALGAVTTAAAGLQYTAVSYPSPGPPDGPLAAALRTVAGKAGAIATLSVPNPGPPGLNIGPGIPDI